MRTFLGLVVVCAGLAACSDDPAPTCEKGGGVGCFTLPTAAMVAHTSATMTAPAALGCGPLVPYMSTNVTTLTGSITDYKDSTKGVGGATFKLFQTSDFATPIAMATTASNGTYSMSIVFGTSDILFGSVTATGYVDAYYANLRPNLTQPITSKFNLSTVTPDFLDQLYTLVRSTQDVKRASIAIGVTDCQRYPIEHAIAVISATSGKRTFFTGAQVFYAAAGAYPVPVLQSVRADTNDNGAVAALNVPVDHPSFLQIWGFPDDTAVAKHEAGLVLVAEYPLTLFAGESSGFNAFANQ